MEDRLQKFARLVELGSFTRTAADLHISQPALTLAVNKLERELRATLLIRTKRKLELTDAGQIVYDAAVEHKTTNENLRAKLVTLKGERPKVAIGMIDSIAAALNGKDQPMENLEARTDLSVIVNNSRYLRQAVERRELDLAFAVQDLATHPLLEIKPAGSEAFLLVCSPDLLPEAQAGLQAKRPLHFISYDRQSTSYGHINQQMQKLGIAVRPTLHSTSPDVMLRMVLRGRGVAALPYLLTKELLESGQLAVLKRDGRAITIMCPISIVRLRGKLLPEPLEAFAGEAQAALAASGIPDNRE